MAGDLQRELAAQLNQQAQWCEALGSRLYAHLLTAAARDAQSGGVVWSALREHMPAPLMEVMLPLRFMASVHSLVLRGHTPALASFYPSAGGDESLERSWDTFRAAVEEQRDEVARLSSLPVQTNEVGRSAALIGGFLKVAAATRLPLRLLEVGASAGLNLRWDRYRYESVDGTAWGPESSPVRMSWDRPPRNLEAPIEVIHRAGCDPYPMNPLETDDRIRLLSAVWPDQLDRVERLRGSFETASDVAVTVERGSASEWLPDALGSVAPGALTVVFHSVVRQYLSEPEQVELAGILAAAGRRASHEAPLAYVTFEPDQEQLPFAVGATLWPDGEQEVVASSGPHGRDITWL